MTQDYEPTEVEYIEDLMDDLDLDERSTIGDLINALEDDSEDGCD
jgi:hypothetical protein